MSAQNGVPILQSDELVTTIRHLSRLFNDATCYVAAIPTYVGGHMAMGFASDDKRLRQASERVIAARYKKAGRFATQYWTPAMHKTNNSHPRRGADLPLAPQSAQPSVRRAPSIREPSRRAEIHGAPPQKGHWPRRWTRSGATVTARRTSA